MHLPLLDCGRGLAKQKTSAYRWHLPLFLRSLAAASFTDRWHLASKISRKKTGVLIVSLFEKVGPSRNPPWVLTTKYIFKGAWSDLACYKHGTVVCGKKKLRNTVCVMRKYVKLTNTLINLYLFTCCSTHQKVTHTWWTSVCMHR